MILYWCKLCSFVCVSVILKVLLVCCVNKKNSYFFTSLSLRFYQSDVVVIIMLTHWFIVSSIRRRLGFLISDSQFACLNRVQWTYIYVLIHFNCAATSLIKVIVRSSPISCWFLSSVFTRTPNGFVCISVIQLSWVYVYFWQHLVQSITKLNLLLYAIMCWHE